MTIDQKYDQIVADLQAQRGLAKAYFAAAQAQNAQQLVVDGFNKQLGLALAKLGRGGATFTDYMAYGALGQQRDSEQAKIADLGAHASAAIAAFNGSWAATGHQHQALDTFDFGAENMSGTPAEPPANPGI